MEGRYYKEYSRELGRDMEYMVFGHGGKLCFAFPPQNGRYWDFNNFHMTDSISGYIESGKLLVVCVDGIDGETYSAKGPGRPRIELQERWFRYVTLELYPKLMREFQLQGKGLVTGCSMGGYHSANFFFRRPDLFDTVISLSGLYEASFFFGSYCDDLTYDNSPSVFIKYMAPDHPYISLYNRSHIILCTGRGAWEDDMIHSLNNFEQVLREKGINAWVDYWGYDVNHDWPWWQRQLPYFLSNLTELR